MKPTSLPNIMQTAPELWEALKYARRFLKSDEVDTNYIDCVLAKCAEQPPSAVCSISDSDLTLEQSVVALREAMEIIESVGTTGIYDKEKKARDWMRCYFPSYAEPGTW